ncbi:MAG: hypothetical protein WC914_00095 [Proteiniphilum sp.]
MTQEEINKRLRPDITYDDHVQEIEAMPAFNRQQAFEEWQGGKKPLLDALMSNYTPPEMRITPEQAKKARFGAAMTDTFGTLAEIFAHSRGANIKQRGGQSSQQATNDRLMQMQEKYEDDLLRYNAALGDAQAKDFAAHLQDAIRSREEERKLLTGKAEKAWQREQAENKAIQDQAKYERDRRDKEASAQTKFERDKELIRERARHRPPTSTQKNEGYMVLNAHPGDPNATTDSMGRKVIPFQFTKEQISGYANSAKSDQAFLDQTPHAYVDSFDPVSGRMIKGLTNDNNLAWMYAQYLYNRQFGSPQPAVATDRPDIGAGGLERSQPTSSGSLY